MTPDEREIQERKIALMLFALALACIGLVAVVAELSYLILLSKHQILLLEQIAHAIIK